MQTIKKYKKTQKTIIMKKGKYIDIYVIMACMSGKKKSSKLRHVEQILKQACKNYEEPLQKNFRKDLALALETSDQDSN